MTARLSFRVGGVETEVRVGRDLDLGAAAGPAGTVTVFDQTTHVLFGAGTAHAVVLATGEQSKQWASAEAVLRRCAEAGLGRDGTVAGVGGGVVCDLAAFAASLYMRGCGLALVPTTLLAMVDASVGGKTGIDFGGWKNLVGTFYPARLVLAATGCLGSLPDRELLSGVAEAVKTAVVGDPGLLEILERRRQDILERDQDLLGEVVRRCLAVKGRIVEQDPVETGVRALLNLGHTFGHALESATGFSVWTHGEAVAWGMGRALAAGELLGITDRAFAGDLCRLLAAWGFRLDAAVRGEELAPGLLRDKKRRGGRLRLVIPRAPGDCVVREVDERDVWRVLEMGGRGTS